MLVTNVSENLDKAVRNLRDIYLVDAAKVSTYDLIDCEILAVDKESIEVLTSILKV
jgi:large subunit ribosomal protein L4